MPSPDPGAILAGLAARIPLEDIAIGARFLWTVPSFLRRPVSLEEARATLRRRLERREADFLTRARRAIYANPASPYRRLLDLAGCEYGDLDRLVCHDGVEGALHRLFRSGVYLTVDEFKGRRPAVRGSTTVTLDPSQLRNPRSAAHAVHRSSGSRGPRTAVPMDLAHLRALAVNMCLFQHARGGASWLKAVWGVPGGSSLLVLYYSAFGAPAVRWFLQTDPAAPGLPARYWWSAHLVRLGGVLARVPLPRPERVPLDRPLPIAHWMVGALRSGATPHLSTFPTAAARLCRAAVQAGLDLRGAQFKVSGEPITAARLAAIRQAGAEVAPVYGCAEGGTIGDACLAPSAPDDVHLLHDLVALIQPGPGHQARGLPAQALLCSSLRPTAPFVLLNVSLGDQAEKLQGHCGCPMEELGWVTHLRTVRSFEKLTAGGMTFLDSDIIRVLEEVLPARLGGGPTDFQLIEVEGEDGRPEVTLLVHPAVGPLDPSVVSDTFLAAIGRGSGLQRVMELQWREEGLLRVERRAPLATASGKILHLHQAGRTATRAGRAADSTPRGSGR